MAINRKVVALRLLDTAMERVDDAPGSRPATIAAVLEQIIAGDLPERGSVARTQISARVDADLLERARKVAETSGWGWASAVDELLLGEWSDW